uniref:TATA box-binding protein-like 1 n=1 Tax=Phallusia mammillata TaxID=59560 RepID=A0A6F9DTT0_9ASCI|nr:TATA-box-binding protein-like [Phallusia mammillata]
MDEYGGTFFDLASSSASYPLCSGGGYLNDLSTFPSVETHAKITGNNIHDQVNDLDSLLLPTTDFPSTIDGDMFQNAASLETLDRKKDVHTELNGTQQASTTFYSNKTIKTETQDSMTFNQTSSFGFMEQTHSLDAILDQSNNTTPSSIPKHVSTVPIKVENPISVPRIIRPDGTTQALTAGSKIQIQGLSSGSKMIRVCVAKTNTVVQQRPEKNTSQAPVQCKQEIFTPFHQTTAFTVTPEQLEPVVNTREDLDKPTHIKVIVSNVVASFRVHCHLSLRRIALEGADVVYRRESQKVVMRLRNPKCTAYMWSSGKVVCTGASSDDNAKKAAKKIARRLQKIGFKVRFSEFKVVNVLAVSKMPYAIDINEFSRAHRGRHCSYEPELHPGVTYRINELKATLKIFSTGSVTVTARSVQRAHDAVKQIYPSFKPFYKFDRPNHWGDFEDALPSDNEDLS